MKVSWNFHPTFHQTFTTILPKQENSLKTNAKYSRNSLKSVSENIFSVLPSPDGSGNEPKSSNKYFEQWLTIFQLVNYCVFNPVWSHLNKHALKWSLSGESLSLTIGLGERLALDKQSLKWNLSNEPTSPRWSWLETALKWIISQRIASE